MSDIVKELLLRGSDKDGIGWLPNEVIPVPARLLHQAADEIERLRAALGFILTTSLSCPEVMVNKARAAISAAPILPLTQETDA